MTTFTTQDRQDAQRKPVAWINLNTTVHDFVDARKYWLEGFEPVYTKQEPLSQDKIWELANKWVEVRDQDGSKVVLFLDLFARAVERAHGIGE